MDGLFTLRSVQQVSLQPDGCFDLEAIDTAIEADPAIRLLHIQRSCGYQWRPSLPIQEIERYGRIRFVALFDSQERVDRVVVSQFVSLWLCSWLYIISKHTFSPTNQSSTLPPVRDTA